MTSSAFSCLRLFGIAVLTAGLSACATAPGPQFTSLPAPVADQSDVYVYRANKFRNNGPAFTLLVDGRAIAELANGSYAGMRLAPGKHVLKVDLEGVRQPAVLAIEVPARSASFYELDLDTMGVEGGPTASLLTMAIARSLTPAYLRPRDGAQATSFLADLRSVSKSSDLLTLERDGAYAAVDTVDAVPALNEEQRALYRAWLMRPFPRAAVIADGGKLFLSSAPTYVPGTSASPVSGASGTQAVWAISDCQASGATGCVVYATNDRVVWVKP